MRLGRPPIPSKNFLIAESMLQSSDVGESEHSAFSYSGTYQVGDRAQVVSPSTTVSISNGAPAEVTWANHGLANDTPVELSTTGTLPNGLRDDLVYFVVNAKQGSFNLATAPGRAPVATSTAGSGTHTATATRHDIFEALKPTADTVSSTNITGNAPVTVDTHWGRVSSTNKWRAFDVSASSQSIRADSMTFEIRPKGFVDKIRLENMDAGQVEVTIKDSDDVTQFNDTFSGVEYNWDLSFYSWCSEPVVRKKSMLIEDLPLITNPRITITLTADDETVALGLC
ncbi:unnamed protein product, partial [Discosporangium mesarthrocarpum]